MIEFIYLFFNPIFFNPIKLFCSVLIIIFFYKTTLYTSWTLTGLDCTLELYTSQKSNFRLGLMDWEWKLIFFLNWERY
ncbi:unnamed protein product [Rhizophagus irregularis]|nr:unnamed protein product [Rhizophagus irregularis]